MAGIITHAFFASDVEEKLIYKKNRNMKFFSYGPDPFYYSRKTIPYARMMHREKTLDFFKNYVNYIIEHKLSKNENVMASLHGFICHYALDTIIHPFVFYKTGIYNKKDKTTYKYMDGHRKLELGLDKYIVEYRQGEFKKYKAHDELFSETYPPEVLKLLNEVLFKTYEIENGGDKYYKCLTKTKQTFKYFRYDPYGIKTFIYTIIDAFKPFRPKLSNYTFYNVKNADLNMKHKEWNHPCDKKEKYNYSALDLYVKAVNTASEMIKKVDKIILKQKKIDELATIIGNMSYLTGKDCNEKNKLKYFEE